MRNNYIPNNQPQDEDQNDDLQQFQQSNSFQHGNEIFELRSQVNSLKIEREKLALEHQRALAAIQARNVQFQNDNKQLRKQKNDLKALNKNLQEQCDQHKRNNENLRNTLENITRKTAEFHKSSPDDYSSYGDPRDMIKQLVQKEQSITKLKKELSSLKNEGKSGSNRHIEDEEYEKIQSEAKALRNQIDQLKKKQISYKRQYENMLQAKQQIIKKMSIHNDESLRRVSESKDKVIIQLRSQLEQKLKKYDSLKSDNKALRQKLLGVQEQVQLVRVSFKKKQEQIFMKNESDKDDLMKNMNQKLKKSLQDKQAKLKKSDNRVYELENQMLVLKQQMGKQKSDITSLQQFNQYLQASNSEYEVKKKKAQQEFYKKQQEIGELRQKYFEQISDLKKQLITQRALYDQKLLTIQEQLTEKRYMVARYEQQSNKRDQTNTGVIKKQYETFENQILKLTREKSSLNQQISQLTEKYKQKSEKLLNLEKIVKKDYQQQIQTLQTELLKAKRKSVDRGQDGYRKQDIESEVKKLKMINQHHQLDKQERIRQLSKIRQKNMNLEQELRDAENKALDNETKYKNKKQDYETLQKQFDELGEKYKKGVRDLQQQIREMTHEIEKLRKSSDRKKQQSQQLQNNLTVQLKQYKNRVRLLSQQLDQIKINKVDNTKLSQMKISKYVQEIAVLKKQKQLAIRTQGKQSKQIESLYEGEKLRLMEYVEQLEESNAMMKDKIDILDKKNKKNNQSLEDELKQLKVEYSQSLTEVNLLLQRYKKLEDIHIQGLADMDTLKQDYDQLHGKFVESFKQKNRILQQLNSAYDQVNKLNSVLMSKQQQLSRTRVVNCPHFDETPQLGYQYHSNNQRNSTQRQLQMQRQIQRDLNRVTINHLSPASNVRASNNGNNSNNNHNNNNNSNNSNLRRKQNGNYYSSRCSHRFN